MKLSRPFLAVAALAPMIVATIAVAQEEPQAIRQAMMKRVGEATGVMTRMVRGQADYDAAAVITALETIQEVALDYPNHFPVGSETGFETEAKPNIWETPDDFRARSEKLAADAGTVIAAAPADLAAFQPLFTTVTDNCGDCHREYRVSKD